MKTDPTKTEKPDLEKSAEGAKPDRLPAAGPHADPRLTNPDATPGSGALPAVGPAANEEGDVDGGVG